MATQILERTHDLAEMFDLDVQVDFDTTTVTDVFSSIACGYSECGTSCSNDSCHNTCMYETCWC